MDMLELLQQLRMQGVKKAKVSNTKEGARVCGEVEFFPVTNEELNQTVMSEMTAAELAWMDSLKEEEKQKYAQEKRQKLFYYSS